MQRLFGILNYQTDGNAVLFRELKVALVMRGNRHDGARPVLIQHEVCDPDRNTGLCERIDRVGACEDALLFAFDGGPYRFVLP